MPVRSITRWQRGVGFVACLLGALGVACFPGHSRATELRRAAAPEPRLEASGAGTLFVRVLDLDNGRRPIALASVYQLPVDSLLLRSGPGALTNGAGTVLLAALPAGQYELRIRRIGYEATARPVAIRAGFVDTLTVGLREFEAIFDDSPDNWH